MTCRRSQVRVLYRPPQKSSDFRLRIFCLVAVQDSNRAALTTPVGRVSNQPSGLLLSPRFPTRRNVYRDDRRFVVGGTGLEQQRRRPPPAAETGSRGWGRVLIFQSPAKGLRKNQQTQPVQAPAVRFRQGSQRLGMSTKKDAARLIRVGSFCFGGRYRTRTARAERSEGNQSPSRALESPAFFRYNKTGRRWAQ